MDEWCEFTLYPAIAYCNGKEELIRIAKEAARNGYIELSDSALKLTELGIRFSKEVMKQLRETNNGKPIKVFISHSGKDKAYVIELVKLFEFIGLKSENLFCSSVPGYNIPLGKGGIYDYLQNEFETHNLFMIYVLSKNYYKSAACLNEMGAAWVLKYQYQSILLPKMSFGDLEGAVDPRELAIKLDDSDTKMLTSRMNDLKDLLVSLLGLEQPNVNTWEARRDDFLENIRKIHESAPKEDENEDDDKPEFRNNSYYWGGDGPYCSCCYDQDGKKIHLLERDNNHGTVKYYCPACKTDAGIKETYPVDLSGIVKKPRGLS